MLSVDEALHQCLTATLPVQAEQVSVGDCLGRVLAEEVSAPHPSPLWSNSAMDGYAVCTSDLGRLGTDQDDVDSCVAEPTKGPGVRLRITEVIAAGAAPKQVVTPGSCARIMTGAPMPQGADAVVMQEHCTLEGNSVVVRGTVKEGQHIRREGEEYQRGDVVLHPGTTVSPAAVGLLASLGLTEVTVARRPTVGIVATGDEIALPGEPLEPGHLYSSNSAALAAMIKQAGAIPVDCGIARDNLESTREAFARAMDCDFALSTGGVSVGDFDVVKQALQEEGANMTFWKVKVKPGKPLAFGRIGRTPIFGLPGNPVSCQVGFLQFMRPVLRCSLGDPQPYLPMITAILDEGMTRKTGRAEFVRVQLDYAHGIPRARTTGSQSSGQVLSMVRANGLLVIPPDVASIDPGSTVQVQVVGGALCGSSSPNYPW